MHEVVKRIIANKYLIYRGHQKGNKIAITFDDGPDTRYTGKLLEELDQAGIKVTFFVIGQVAEKHPDLIKLMIQQGHEVANHSYTHNRIYNSAEIRQANRVLQNITGIIPGLFRPPWGKITLTQLWFAVTHGMKLILWSVDSLDFRLGSAQELKDSMQRAKITPGDIILFHEDYQQTVEALPDILRDLKARGFLFSTISGLLEKDQ